MKKLLLSTLLLISVASLAQGLKPIKGSINRFYSSNSGGVGIGINYGFKSNSLGLEVTSIKTNSVLWGGGASISFNAPEHNGILLHENYGWTTPNNTTSGDTYSVYGIGGYTFKNIKAYGKLGLGVSETVGHYNHYNQWHYKVLDTNTVPLVGVGLGFGQNSLCYDLSFDTYNGFTLGLTFVL
jgi:hypothetical protein